MPIGPTSKRRRNLRFAGLAAAAALCVGAVGVIQSQRDSAAPSGDEPQGTAPIVPAAFRPGPITVFPDVGPFGSFDDATYSQLGVDNPWQVSAVVAQRTGTTVENGVAVTVGESTDDGVDAAATKEQVVVNGVNVTVVTTSQDNVVIRTVVFPGSPVLKVVAIDPVAFLTAAGPNAIRVDPVTSPGPGHPAFTIGFGTLPPGYEVVVPPAELPLGLVTVGMTFDPTGPSESAYVAMSWIDPLETSVSRTMRAVDINGHTGWISNDPANAVSWEQEPGQFVNVRGADTAQESLALARGITFIDEETWKAKYNVYRPEFDTTRAPADFENAPATT